MKAARELTKAARKFAAAYLADTFETALAEFQLQKAAIGWAEARAPKRAKRSPRAKEKT